MPTGSVSGAAGINNRGSVAGWSGTSMPAYYAFLWSKKTGMEDLGTLPVTPGYESVFSSWANGLNDRDFVVGGSWYDAERNHAFLWTRGDGMEDLGVPAGFVGSSDAYGINASGLVVGTASEGVVEGAAPHAFLWTRLAGMTLLENLPGGLYSFARGINNLDQVVGEAAGSGSDECTHAVLWGRTGNVVDLGVWNAAAVNDEAVVVGSLPTNAGSDHAAYWTRRKGIQDLGTLPGGNEASQPPLAIWA